MFTGNLTAQSDGMKGISSFVSIILIIAIAVTVASLFSIWFVNFVKNMSTSVEERSSQKITCTNAGIALENVKYNTTSGNITGYIRNTDIIALGDIDVEIFLTNTTRIVLDNNMTLAPGEQDAFIYHLATTEYDLIRVRTNCSNVHSQVSSSQVAIIT